MKMSYKDLTWVVKYLSNKWLKIKGNEKENEEKKKKKKTKCKKRPEKIGLIRISPFPSLTQVKTHTLILALFSVKIVSGTPSCSLSSMAVAPNSLE